MSIAAYRATLRHTEDPRAIERRLIARVTGAMEQHAEAYDSAPDLATRQSILAGGLSAALSENATIWRTLKDDLAQPGNRLAPSLRAGLISLALWMERETVRILGGGGRIAPLVEINGSIVSGLSGEAPGPAAVSA